jgi:hypothetical protein
MDADSLRRGLDDIRFGFHVYLIQSRGIENASISREALRELAKKARELATFMKDSLGPGAVEVMRRRTTRKDLLPFAEPLDLPEKDRENPPTLSCIPVEEGHRYSSPTENRSTPRRFVVATEDENDRFQKEWRRGGRWVMRLEALAELAQMKADHMKEQASRIGRKSGATLLYGPPGDWLAEACREYAETHGCQKQAVAQKMYIAIMDAECGKDSVRRRKDGKPSKDKGRKAVKKMAQTKPKAGTV